MKNINNPVVTQKTVREVLARCNQQVKSAGNVSNQELTAILVKANDNSGKMVFPKQ